MTKFNSNILKIKLFYLSIIGKIKKNNFIINTNSINKANQSILIIFPVNQIEFDVAKYSFRNLLSNSNNNYIYLINNTYYSNSHFMGTTYGFNYFKNKIVVNSNFYSDNIIDEKIDIVIDLNSSFFFRLCNVS